MAGPRTGGAAGGLFILDGNAKSNAGGVGCPLTVCRAIGERGTKPHVRAYGGGCVAVGRTHRLAYAHGDARAEPGCDTCSGPNARGHAGGHSNAGSFAGPDPGTHTRDHARAVGDGRATSVSHA